MRSLSRPADRITLTGLRATGYHGVFDHEKREGQEFIIDIVLSVDHRLAGRTDDLDDTLNYAQVAEVAIARITGPSYDLIEALAEAIAGDCLTLDGVAHAEVTVHKPGAPIAHTFSDVSVTVTRARSAEVVIALGSNLGDREATLRAAVSELRGVPGLRVLAVSRPVETDPVGGPEQGDYLNAVIRARTDLAPYDVLSTLHRIEARHGRTRAVRWGERTLDLDLIQYGSPGKRDEVRSDDPALLLPHPRAVERAFVLLPWLDADPRARVRVGADIVPLAALVTSVDSSGVRPYAGVLG